MWADFSGKAYSREDFAKRIDALKWTTWKPIGIVLHNTAAPTLEQWAESGPKHAARIKNLQHYYEGLGWHGGPHWFISRDWLNEFSNPLRRGTHSPSFNATHFGIEMVGDFAKEAFNSGDGAKVRDNAAFAMAVLCRNFGWDPAKVIVLHKEDPKTDHDCPGKNVVKATIIERVLAEIGKMEVSQPPAAPEPVPPPFIVNPADIRRRMALAIYNAEARRDNKGNLQVYSLPAGDGGGTYEVAGINDRYHPDEAWHLANLVRAGKYAEAETYAQDFLVKYTDVVKGWHPDAGVEFFLRDCAFNRGPKGAARIWQRALGVNDDGVVGPKTRAAVVGKTAHQLLTRLRAAREQYERDVAKRSESSKFWKGLVNRWNSALGQARSFSLESPTLAKSSMFTGVGIVAASTAAAAGGTQWFGDHIWLSLGAALFAAIVASLLVGKFKS